MTAAGIQKDLKDIIFNPHSILIIVFFVRSACANIINDWQDQRKEINGKIFIISSLLDTELCPKY
jgi:hypothetical protein